jgi:hypothetical protein
VCLEVRRGLEAMDRKEEERKRKRRKRDRRRKRERERKRCRFRTFKKTPKKVCTTS